jgi:hypothetical protein
MLSRLAAIASELINVLGLEGAMVFLCITTSFALMFIHIIK